MKQKLLKIWLIITLSISLYIILTYAKSMFIPLISALLLSPAFVPIVRFTNKYKIPEWLTISISITIVIFVAGFLMYLLAINIADTYEVIEKFIKNSKELHDNLFEYISKHIKIKRENLQYLEEKLLDAFINTMQNVLKFASEALSITTNFISYFLLTALYLFFILIYRHRIINALFMMKITKEIFLTYENFKYIINKMGRYIYAVFIVMFLMFFLLGTILWVLRVPHPFLWAGIASVSNLIPYLGMTIVGLSCATFTAIVTQNFIIFVVIMIVFWSINLLENNIITPTIAGRNLELNALSILIFAFIGFYVWGIIGSILSIPILIFTKLIAMTNSKYKLWDILISE